MKNVYIITIFLLYILIPAESFSQAKEKRYYYAYDEKVYLNEIENKFIVSFQKDNIANIKSLINTAETEFTSDSICIITVDYSQKEGVKKTLLQTKGVKSVQPMYANDGGSEMGITDEFVVKYKAGVSQKQKDEWLKKHPAVLRQETELYLLMSAPVGEDALEIANLYQLSGLVEYSHPNFIAKIEAHAIPSDPYFVNQFYLHNTGQTFNGHSGYAGADINAPEAWDITKGSSDVIIAVLDQGVTSNHPDLPNTRQVRLNGSNFADGNVNDPSPTGDNNHGNSCAGVIAASHNSEGIAGIAPNCKIMPVRIFNSNGSGISSTQLAAAITFAKNNGAYIISNSWGYTYVTNPNAYPVIVDAISDATTNGRGGKGCVVVFSAGNTATHVSGDNGWVTFPSNVNVQGVLTVGASDRYDEQADYSPTSDLSSSYHQIVDVMAPSHRAYSCNISTESFECWTIDIPGTAGDNTWKNTGNCYLPLNGTTFPNSGTNYQAYTGYFGGTSCAAPEVSAVAALILSINPTLTQQEVADIIESTARKAGGYNYQITSGIPNGTWNSQMGHGVLNASAAVQAACAIP
ncbi:MAG: S8 family serine peptidase, partial [Prevotellaceae bacterium]|nr:S8 family serine peptidase [Prevotellaceae bacterium]